MTDIEKRRLQLLHEVRKNYSDKNIPPAIHPRYQSVYHSLYNNETEEDSHPHSTFLLRLVIAILLFTLVFSLERHGEEIMHINTQTIVNEVQKELLRK